VPVSTLSSVAIRVHKIDAMVAFYSDAFGAQFHEVDTFGIRSKFGDLGDVVLKLVPIRDDVDFEGFPLHQLGFDVPDAEAIIPIAEQHGGRQHGATLREGSTTHVVIRDPDGNTLELYSSQ
jgi:catechol 2,3-dioxygenase-like lactoylglutathione lyase family enzyme